MTTTTLAQNFKSPWVVISLFLLIATTLAALWFFNNFEKKEYTVHSGSSPQAKSNPLLAAQEYLQQTSYHSESIKGLDILTELPPATDAIFIRHLPAGLNDAIISNLLNWVEQGGHLLIVPNQHSLKSNYPGRTTLFEQLGVDFVEEEKSDCGCPENDTETAVSPATEKNTEDSAGEDQKKEKDQPKTITPAGPRHYLISTELDKHPVQLETFTPRLLTDKSNSAVFTMEGSYSIEYENDDDKHGNDQNDYRERDGAWLLQYQIGIGKVTVLSELNLFTNNTIGDFDHAFFLSWLTQDDSTIWLLFSTNVDSFLKILWEKAPLFWATLAFLILLIIWRLQLQSGVQLCPPLDDRHNIMEHIDATAQYYWRTNNLKTMVNHNREGLWKTLIGRKMGIRSDQKNVDIDISRLSQKTGMPQKQLHSAFQQPIETEQDIIQTSKLMQQLNTHISGGDKREK